MADDVTDIFDNQPAPERHPHPAALPIDELVAACRMTRGRTSGPGGQHRNKVATAVTLTHEPTGINATATERRQPEDNRRKAIKRLRIRLALDHREPLDTKTYRPSKVLATRINRQRRLSLSPNHEDFASVLAELLDVILAFQGDVAEAGTRVGLTSSQIIRLLKHEPVALTTVNRWRAAQQMRPLR